MEYVFAFGLLPALGVYLLARRYYHQIRGRFHLRTRALNAQFTPLIVGWGIAAVVLWFFFVTIWIQIGGPERTVLLLLAPYAFAAGEGFGLYMWYRKMKTLRVKIAARMPKQEFPHTYK